jgi:Fur family ferric uptake transcriptional regulator
MPPPLEKTGARSAKDPARPRRPAASPVQALATLLAERGLKHSRQRDLIVEAFFDMGGHVPVDALVARVHEQDARVSVATVYRTMKLLVDCGLASARHFGDGQTRYEPAMQRDHHDHLICTRCGAIHEFESERIEELQERVARRHGFVVEHHRLEIYGRCGECRAAGEETAA